MERRELQQLGAPEDRKTIHPKLSKIIADLMKNQILRKYCKTLQTNRISADVKKLDDNNEQTPHWAMLQLIPQRINLWMTTEDTEQDNVGRWTMYFNETIYQELNPHLYD